MSVKAGASAMMGSSALGRSSMADKGRRDSFANAMRFASMTAGAPGMANDLLSKWVSDANRIAAKKIKTEMDRMAEDSLKEQVEAAKNKLDHRSLP